jgi:GNAT superfamily N-acetyltransferase
MPELRPMRDHDVAAVHELSVAAFADLARRLSEPPRPEPEIGGAHLRVRHVLRTDPRGAWVAQDEDGSLAGAALAIVREGIWGLSLLVVRPGAQSDGLGSALLGRSLDYGAGTRGGIILASPDSRALRAYSRAGFALHPTVYATGPASGVVAAPEVRPFTPDDHALAAAVDRAVRGAAHGADLDALADGGCELLTFPERGYVAHREGTVKLLAAFDDEAAAALLRTVLARIPPGGEAEVEWLTSAQGWAIDVAVEARLELRPGGGVFLRGDTGPFRPYLPGGAYL